MKSFLFKMKTATCFFFLFLISCSNSFNTSTPKLNLEDELLLFSVSNWRDQKKYQSYRAIMIHEEQVFHKNKEYEDLNEFFESTEFADVKGLSIRYNWTPSDRNRIKIEGNLENRGVKFVEVGTKEWVEARRIYLDRTTGSVKGKVYSSETGKALENVFVSVGAVGGDSDKNGEFQFADLEPGTLKVEAKRADLIPLETKVVIGAKNTASLELEMSNAPSACCNLDGRWLATLKVESDKRPVEERPKPMPKVIAGEVIFGKNYASPLNNNWKDLPDSIHKRAGEYRIDLTKVFGANFTKSSSTTIFGVPTDVDPLFQIIGTVYNSNEVRIVFIPAMSHGGLSFEGNIVDNKMFGRWYKRGYVSKVSGTFEMIKLDN